MEGNKKKLRAVLVFGAPGSGKTTFAEKFAKKFNLAYYNLDEIINLYYSLFDFLFYCGPFHFF